MKVTKPGFVYLSTSSYSMPDDYTWFSFEFKSDKDYALIGPCAIEFEVPENFNLNKIQIEALQAQKKEAMAAFQNRITEIDRQIGKLTAIENVVTA